MRHYDDLAARSIIGNSKNVFLRTCHSRHERFTMDYFPFYEIDTHYQFMEFYYDAETEDTCLFLDGMQHTCSSLRAVQEALIHYPASFLRDVKRVAFIGGGDNLFLHELMKYPSIELVVCFYIILVCNFNHCRSSSHISVQRWAWNWISLL